MELLDSVSNFTVKILLELAKTHTDKYRRFPLLTWREKIAIGPFAGLVDARVCV
jgi:hypothetical protein